MKLHHRLNFSLPSVEPIWDAMEDAWTTRHRNRIPLILFLVLCFNGLCAPAVFAATGGDLSKVQAWAIALLSITVVSLSGYLFVVMFQPERF